MIYPSALIPYRIRRIIRDPRHELNLSQKLQLRIRCCGFAPNLAEIVSTTPDQLTEAAQIGNRAAWWLTFLARLPAKDAPKVAELILMNWKYTPKFFTLREIRNAISTE